VLAPVEGWRARFFDISGEGTYWRAVALLALKKDDEAVRLLAVAAQVGGVWGQKAREKRAELEGKQAVA
jgi:hypothetical protein